MKKFEEREDAIYKLNELRAKLYTLSNPIKIKVVKRQIKEIEKYLKS